MMFTNVPYFGHFGSFEPVRPTRKTKIFATEPVNVTTPVRVILDHPEIPRFSNFPHLHDATSGVMNTSDRGRRT